MTARWIIEVKARAFSIREDRGEADASAMRIVATVARKGLRTQASGDARSEANAHLIAAAPNLHAALVSMVREIRAFHPSFDARVFVDAEHAIAMAEAAPCASDGGAP